MKIRSSDLYFLVAMMTVAVGVSNAGNIGTLFLCLISVIMYFVAVSAEKNKDL